MIKIIAGHFLKFHWSYWTTTKKSFSGILLSLIIFNCFFVSEESLNIKNIYQYNLHCTLILPHISCINVTVRCFSAWKKRESGQTIVEHFLCLWILLVSSSRQTRPYRDWSKKCSRLLMKSPCTIHLFIGNPSCFDFKTFHGLDIYIFG